MWTVSQTHTTVRNLSDVPAQSLILHHNLLHSFHLWLEFGCQPIPLLQPVGFSLSETRRVLWLMKEIKTHTLFWCGRIDAVYTPWVSRARAAERWASLGSPSLSTSSESRSLVALAPPPSSSARWSSPAQGRFFHFFQTVERGGKTKPDRNDYIWQL